MIAKTTRSAPPCPPGQQPIPEKARSVVVIPRRFIAGHVISAKEAGRAEGLYLRLTTDQPLD